MLGRLTCKTELSSTLATAASNVPEVIGLATEYRSTIGACIPPEGSVEACKPKVQGYAKVLISAGAWLEEARGGFPAPRLVSSEINAKFQQDAGALFEQRLPPPEALVGVPASLA